MKKVNEKMGLGCTCGDYVLVIDAHLDFNTREGDYYSATALKLGDEIVNDLAHVYELKWDIDNLDEEDEANAVDDWDKITDVKKLEFDAYNVKTGKIE